MKLAKENLVFIKDPKTLEFLKYCKETYSKNIKSINLQLNEEYDDWQMTVKEGDTGFMWVPWFIPTSTEVIIEGSMYSDKPINTKYYETIKVINDENK
jgi:hypothetical protein